MEISFNELDSEIAGIKENSMMPEYSLVCDGFNLEYFESDVEKTYNIYLQDDWVGNISFELGCHSLYVQYIQIDPAFQHKGLATKILKFLIKYYDVTLIVGEARNISVPFWNTLGANLPLLDEDDDFLIPFMLTVNSNSVLA